MNLQYISDNKGTITGVFIPIRDWNYLKNKCKEIAQEEINGPESPERQRRNARQRLREYQYNPDNIVDWDNVQKEIEREYGFLNFPLAQGPSRVSPITPTVRRPI